MKINYDEASKGNPGQVGEGGIFQDSKGLVWKIYAMDLGFTMNNEAELMEVKPGL